MTTVVEHRLHRSQLRLLTLGILALGVSIPGAFLDPKQFFVAYAYSYFFWLGLPIGCVLVVMILHLTGAEWGEGVRRIMEAGFSTFPLMGLLFLPILLGLHELYPWARPEEVASSEVLQKRASYFALPFFLIRAALYFCILVLLTRALRKWSLLQDLTSDFFPARRLMQLSGFGLVIVPLIATFAYIDWIMSMEKAWYSSVFPIIILAGQLLAALCFATFIRGLFKRMGALSSTLTESHSHALANLMLTFVMFWAYVVFVQFLIVYSANGPEAITWYLHRTEGNWMIAIWLIALFHFFLPFCFLLFKPFKKRGAFVAGVALIILSVHLLYTFWLVSPSAYHHGIHLSWLTVTVPVGLGGVWLGRFLSLVRSAPLIPRHNPRIQEEFIHAEA